MTLHIYNDVIQGTEEWHAQRRGLVTASVVGKLVTPSTLKPAANDESRNLTALLVAERLTGYTDPTWQSDDMLRGIDDEPRARDLYSKHHAPAVECGFMTRDLGVGVLGCSPDGLVGDDGMIEIKSRRSKKQLQTILAGKVPAENVAQCQAALLVSGRDWLDYVSYSGGMPLFVVRVHPDIRWFEAITQALAKFEETAAQMEAQYLNAVMGLPTTERIAYGEVELKL